MNKKVDIIPKGQYNLNFIDWQNEYQTIMDSGYTGEEAPEKSPIYGMDAKTFHQLMLEGSRQMEYEQEKLQRQLNGLGDISKIKKMKAGNTNKECSICIKKFIKGEIIRVLKCNHVFHDGCLLPWLQKHSQCPNCRKNLKTEEESDI